MTEKRYHEEVAEIAKIHPSNIFLKSLRAGHTSATEAYLVAAWQLVPKDAVSKEPQPSQRVPSVLIQEKQKNDHPEAVNDLFRAKGHIHREMRKIKATDLMAAQTVQERRVIMHKLDEMQDEWAVVQRRIRVWEVTKVVPEAVIIAHNAEASFEERVANLDSLTDLELSGRLATARTSVSRMKSRIEKFTPGAMEKAHPQHKKWLDNEQKLRTYEREKLHIEAALKRRKNTNDGKETE